MGAALALTSFALIGYSAAPDGGLEVVITPDHGSLAPGETATLTACGAPGDFVLFMLDLEAGPNRCAVGKP